MKSWEMLRGRFIERIKPSEYYRSMEMYRFSALSFAFSCESASLNNTAQFEEELHPQCEFWKKRTLRYMDIKM